MGASFSCGRRWRRFVLGSRMKCLSCIALLISEQVALMIPRYTFIVWALCLGAISLLAQRDTIVICLPGEAVQLDGPPDRFAYAWQPASVVSNASIRNPVARPQLPTWFVVTSLPELEGDNLILNPDFSLGDTAFLSDYPFRNIINTQGVYGISTSAANLNPQYFSDCPDRSGNGLMMVVDGSPRANERVWCQRIPVEPMQDYAFSTWLMSVNATNPALLAFSINGQPLGNRFMASSRVCEWRQFFTTWFSDTASVAEICIVNQNTNPQGNDFALDDFAFFPITPPQVDSTWVRITALEEAQQRRVYFPTAFSPNFDGVNDSFQPAYGKEVVRVLDFAIFDRWGGLVFQRRDCLKGDCGWDGYSRGRAAEAGYYVYKASVLFVDQQTTNYSGELLLLRP